VILLLPTFLRKARLVAWLQILIAPLEQLQYSFNQKRNSDLVTLTHNGQKCYLRKILNDSFDQTLRRICIEDMTHFNAVYIYTEAENQPVYLEEKYLYTSGEMHVSGVNFSVRIPNTLRARNVEIKAIIEAYKIASKRYIIIYE
jgi:hypothetical protein